MADLVLQSVGYRADMTLEEGSTDALCAILAGRLGSRSCIDDAQEIGNTMLEFYELLAADAPDEED